MHKQVRGFKMYTLLKLQRFMANIKSGTQTATLREGQRDIPIGWCQIDETNGQEDSLRVYITDVEYTTFCEITDEQAAKVGYASADDARADLVAIYVDDIKRYDKIEPDHPITLAHWGPESVTLLPGTRPNGQPIFDDTPRA